MKAWPLSALLLTGCATSTLVLLKGEGNSPAGSVAVIDPKSGNDVRMIETAGSKVVVAGSRTRMRALEPEVADAKYSDLLAYLPEPPVRYVLYFPEGSSDFAPSSLQTRDKLLAEVTRRGAGVDVQIEGHTDRVGGADDNLRLSRERAQAAMALLVPLGLRDNITRVVGRGEYAPVPGHGTADGVADPINRRVEVVVR